MFGEVHALALHDGARAETFAGTAGVGDLVATVIADGSRNRRAGEMLAHGVRPDEIRARLGETPEALDAVALLQQALERRMLPADRGHRARRARRRAHPGPRVGRCGALTEG